MFGVLLKERTAQLLGFQKLVLSCQIHRGAQRFRQALQRLKLFRCGMRFFGSAFRAQELCAFPQTRLECWIQRHRTGIGAQRLRGTPGIPMHMALFLVRPAMRRRNLLQPLQCRERLFEIARVAVRNRQQVQRVRVVRNASEQRTQIL